MVHLLHTLCRAGVHNTEQGLRWRWNLRALFAFRARYLRTEFPLEETNYGVTEHPRKGI